MWGCVCVCSCDVFRSTLGVLSVYRRSCFFLVASTLGGDMMWESVWWPNRWCPPTTNSRRLVEGHRQDKSRQVRSGLEYWWASKWNFICILLWFQSVDCWGKFMERIFRHGGGGGGGGDVRLNWIRITADDCRWMISQTIGRGQVSGMEIWVAWQRATRRFVYMECVGDMNQMIGSDCK